MRTAKRSPTSRSVVGTRKRPYDASRRAAAATARRRAVVDAVHRMLDTGEAPRLALEDVAAEVGLSRATIYNQFGSRRGLLVAVMEDLGRAIRYERVQEAQRIADPVEALRATISEACRCWAAGRDEIRRILAIGLLDREIAELNARFEMHRRAECAGLARRLSDAGHLGPGVSLGDAEVVLGALTGPTAFTLFGGDSDPDGARARLTRSILASLELQGARAT
jgi:AcrR family transcriptional regulator